MTDAPGQPVAEEASSTTPTSPRRWLIPLFVGIAIIALVVMALVRGETRFDPTSPEGAVQEYLQAIADERWEDALDVVDPQISETCGPSNLANHVYWTSFSAVHESTTHGLSTVYVNVRIDYTEGSGIWGGGGWTNQFSLYEDNGLWYITDDPWPHFRYSCSRF